MAALPAPKLRHIYRLDADLGAATDLGHTPQGHRRIVALAGGREIAAPELRCTFPAPRGGRNRGPRRLTGPRTK